MKYKEFTESQSENLIEQISEILGESKTSQSAGYYALTAARREAAAKGLIKHADDHHAFGRLGQDVKDELLNKHLKSESYESGKDKKPKKEPSPKIDGKEFGINLSRLQQKYKALAAMHKASKGK